MYDDRGSATSGAKLPILSSRLRVRVPIGGVESNNARLGVACRSPRGESCGETSPVTFDSRRVSLRRYARSSRPRRPPAITQHISFSARFTSACIGRAGFRSNRSNSSLRSTGGWTVSAVTSRAVVWSWRREVAGGRRFAYRRCVGSRNNPIVKIRRFALLPRFAARAGTIFQSDRDGDIRRGARRRVSFSRWRCTACWPVRGYQCEVAGASQCRNGISWFSRDLVRSACNKYRECRVKWRMSGRSW